MADRRPRAGRFTAPTPSRQRHDPAETRPSQAPEGLPRPLRVEAVAGVFVAAYARYAWTEPRPAYRAVKTAPPPEPVLCSTFSVPAPGSRETWSDVVATHTIATATVDGVRQPDGAPPPDRMVDLIAVLTRRTTSDRGRVLDHPVVYARLASTPGGWRVAALLNDPLQP